MAGEAEIFDLSKLISNRGYDFIVEAIFTNMDPPSLAKCRLVSKSWKALIDSRKSILICQLQWLKQNKLEYPDAKVWYKLRRIVQSQRKYSIIEKFPELRQVFLDLERNATEHELSIIVMFLQKYSKNQKFPIETLRWEKRILISPLHQAIIQGDQEFIRIIMKRTKMDFLMPIQLHDQMFVTYSASAVHDQALVQLFLDYALSKGINVNESDGKGRTAFHYACRFGTMEAVKVFLENVKEEFLQVNLLDQDGYSPLHMACICNHPETVQLLLNKSMELGININAIDRNGCTVLHLAVQHGHDKVVKVLIEASIEHGINVNALNFQWKTPFTIACMNGHLEIAKLMIQESRNFGIDLNILDWNSKSAMYYAIKNKHLDIARVMIDESKDKNIALNQENGSFRTDLFTTNAWINSVGGLVFGRRPDLWNPLLISYYYCFSSSKWRTSYIHSMDKINANKFFFYYLVLFFLSPLSFVRNVICYISLCAILFVAYFSIFERLLRGDMIFKYCYLICLIYGLYLFYCMGVIDTILVLFCIALPQMEILIMFVCAIRETGSINYIIDENGSMNYIIDF